MAIYELEERVFFDGALPVDVAEVEDMSNQEAVDSCQLSVDGDSELGSTENVSIASGQYSVDSSQSSVDSEQSVETPGSASENHTSYRTYESYMSHDDSAAVPDSLDAIFDSLSNTSETSNINSEINQPNVLLVSSENDNYEEITSSVNDNTIIIEYSSEDSVETILKNLKVELGESKAVNIGIIDSAQLPVAGSQSVETCGNTSFSAADLCNALSEIQTVDGKINFVDIELGGGSVDSDLPLTEFFDTESSQFSSLIDSLTTDNSELTTDLYFIDSQVENSDSLIEEITSENPDAVIVELTDGEGLDSMTYIVNQYTDIDSVHIVSQGNYAQIMLGDDVITKDNIGEYQDAFASWNDNLTQDADILFYGCDIAKEAAGREVLNQIADWTGADIAASTDITGGILNHGTHGNGGSISNFSFSLTPIHSSTEVDFDLEYTIGSIEASAIAAANYNPHLETYTVTETTDDGSGTVEGSLSWAVEQANATATVDDIINFNLSEGNTVTVSGDLLVTDDLTINGSGVTVAFSNAANGFIFDDGVDISQINVIINDMTIVEACGNTSLSDTTEDINLIRNTENLTISNTNIDDIGYVYAHIPGNIENPKVLLVSSILNDVDDLVAAAKDDVIVLEYDPEVTSLTELSTMVENALNGRKASSIAFANHSSGDNQFYLTDSEVISLGSTFSSAEQQEFWAGVGSMISDGGRIDLLACNLASGSDGEMLIAGIESFAGINVAASTDATGNPENGGDWILETDNISSEEYFQSTALRDYTELMGSSVFASGTAIGSADATYSIAIADMNNDGLLDVVAGNLDQTNKLYLQASDGSFAATGIAVGSGDADRTWSIAVGDMNNDGLLDVVAGNQIQINKLYLQASDGSFAVNGTAIGSEKDDTYSIALADMNNDGLLDVVAGNNGQTNKLYLQASDGSFAVNGTAIGSEQDETYSIALADMNNDGLLDVVAGGRYQTNKLYLQESDGSYAAGIDIGSETDDTKSIAVADMNNDGLLDVVAGNNYKRNKLYLQESDGSYAAGIDIGSETDATWSITVADMNNDGLLDVVVGNYNDTNKLYLQESDGSFAAGIAIVSDADDTLSIVLADMNNDGLLDVVAGNNGETKKLYLQQSSVAFYSASEIGSDTDNTFSIPVADMNNDGLLDVVAGNYGETNKLYLQASDGSYAAGIDIGSDTDNTYSIAVADMNNDGLLDVVAGNYGETNKLYLQELDGSFASGIDIGSDDTGEEGVTASIAVGDMNNDGLLDVVAGNNGTNKLYLQESDGSFAETGIDIGGNTGTYSIAVADMNNDGLLDIVAGDYGETNKLYLQASDGSYAAGIDIGSDTDYTYSIVVADMNNDGLLDVVAGNYNGTNKLYLQQSSVAFYSASEIGSETDATLSIAVADMNNDGLLDVVAGNFTQTNKLYLQESDGSYASGIDIGSDVDQTWSIAVGDMNNDGLLDVVAGNQNQTNKLYLQELEKNFTYGRDIDDDEDTTYSTAVADMNNDGLLDVVAGNLGQINKLYLQENDGSYASGIDIGNDEDNTFSIAVGDMNNDGLLDVVAGNGSTNKLYLQQSNGTFESGTAIGSEEDGTVSIAVGDMNNDGLLDVVAGNAYATNKLYLQDEGTEGVTFSSAVNIGIDTDTTQSIAVGDMNNDGLLDVVAGNNGQTNKLYLQESDGSFASGIDIGSEEDGTNSIAVGDMNNDGLLDVVAGKASQTNKLYFQASDGSFAAGIAIGSDTDDTYSIAVGDMNNDGLLDVVAGNYNGTNKVYFQASVGSFLSGTDIGIDTDKTYSIAVGDMNNDGLLDVVAGNESATNKIYLQDYLYQYQTVSDGEWNNKDIWQRRVAGVGEWETLISSACIPDYYDESITINNSVSVTADITVDQTTIAAGGILTIADGIVFTVADKEASTDLTVTGSIIEAGENGGLCLNTNSIVLYNGEDQTITAAEYYNLTVGNSGTKTISVGTSISGTGVISGTAQVLLDAGAANKVYDGNTTADVTINPSNIFTDYMVSLNGSGTFADANAGLKTVNLTGLSLSGDDSDKFTLNAAATVTATITQKVLTATAVGESREYDGTTSASLTSDGWVFSGLVGIETLSVDDYTASFASKDVLTHGDITLSSVTLGDGTGTASNYSLASTAVTLSGGDITAKVLTATADGVTREYDGTTDTTLSNWNLTGLVGTEALGVTGTGAFDSANAGTTAITADSVTLSDGVGGSASNYSLANTAVTAAGSITAKVLTATADGVTREYDGTTDTTLSNWNLTGLVGTEALGVTGTGSFDSANAGTTAITADSVTLSDGTGTASNYSLANTAVTAAGSITQKVLSATAVGESREYDGTTSASLTSDGWVFSGLVGTETLSIDDYTASFATKDVLTHGDITLSSVTLGDGTGLAANYSLASTAVTLSGGDITAKVLSATADGVTREYDGTTDTTLSNWNLTGLVDGEALGVTGTGAFDSANAGTTAITADSVTLSDGTGTASNYSLANTAVTAAGSITQKVLTATADGVTREYDGTTDTTLSNWNLTGLVDGEALGVTGTGAFDSANAGTTAITADSVTISDGAGGSASNYSLANTAVTAAGSITQKVLTAAAVGESREYDGTTSASLTSDGWVFSGLVGTETLSVDDYTASFATKDVLTHGDITLSSVTLGDGTGLASNYSLASTAVTVSGGDITAKVLTATADGVTREYDGTTDTTLSNWNLTGLVDGEALGVAGTGAFDSANAGTTAITAGSVTLSDGTGTASNYSLANTAVTAAGEITQKVLSATADGVTREYDGTTDTTLSNWNLTGLVDGEALGVAGTGAFDSANAGTTAITADSVTLSDGTGTASNYSLAKTAVTAAGSITQKVLTAAAEGETREYDGTTDTTLSNWNLTGLVGGEALGVTGTGAFDSANAGTTAITADSVTLSDGAGGSASNYSLAATAVTVAGEIQVKNLTATAVGESREYDGTKSASLTADGWAFSGLVGTETLSIDDYTASFATKDVLTHGDITLSSVTLGDGTGLASNYFLKDSDVTVSGGDITAKVLSATADGVTREYDGTTDTTLSNWNLTGLVDGEALGVAGTGAFDSANAGTTAITAGSVTLSDGTGTASNYSLANTAVTAAGSITQKVLTATADGVTREYDGTTDTTLSNWNLTGLVDGEALGVAGTGAFDSANAGTTAITAGSVTLSDGTGTASNYSLANTAVTAAGEITQKVLSATADGVTREYDGTTDTTLSNWNLTGLVDGEALGVAGTGAFDSANAGTTAITADSVTLSDGTGTASNYSLAKTAVTAAGSITQKVLTAAAEGETREYDGTTDTTLSNWNLTGLVGGEALGVTGTGAFDSANAGTTAITADSVTLSDGAGGSASNYSLAATAVTVAGEIQVKNLTATAVGESREYDGTKSASLTADGWAFSGLVGTETLSIDDYTASFATKDVLTHGDITLSSVTLGDGTGLASNYFLKDSDVTVSGGDITAKVLSATADGVTREYDGTTDTTLSNWNLTGLVDGEALGVAGTGAFDSANAGTTAITAGSVTLSDGTGTASNYSLANTAVTAAGSITQKVLTATADGVTREYDGTTDTTLSNWNLTGLVDGEALGVTGTGAFDSANAGTTAITAGSVTLSDGTGTASNYSLANTAVTAAGEITQKVLSATADGVTREYDGTTDTTLSNWNLTGLVDGEALGVAGTGAFDSANAGTTAITADSVTLSDGTGTASNYSLANTAVTAAGSITQKVLTAAAEGETREYDGTTDTTLSNWNLTGLVGTEALGVTGTGAFDSANAGTTAITADSVTLSDGAGGSASNYSLAATAVTVAGEIQVKNLTATAVGESREYDGTKSASLTADGWAFSGLVGTETLSIDDYTASFATKDVLTHGDITLSSVTLGDGTGLASNYFLKDSDVTVSGGDITAKVLSATADGVTREYDGTTDTTLSNWNLTGLVDGEALGVAGTGAFDSANAGTTAITAGSVTLSDGTGTASNYSLANTAVTAAGSITQKVLTATADGVTREYDGTTDTTLSNWNLTGLVDGEALGVAGTGAFDSANAGTTAITAGSVTLSDGTGTASNYSLANTAVTAAGEITQKVLSATADGVTREYDGTTDTTLTNWNLTGLIDGETLGVTGTGAFDSANAGTTAITADSVTLSDGTGTASNYSLANTAVTAAGSITQKVLTAAAEGETREYDGTTDTTLSNWNLTGLVGTEALGVTGTGAFDSANAGTTAITADSVTLSDGAGGSASNYSLAATAVTVAGEIQVKNLTATAVGESREYDGTKSASLTADGWNLTGLVGTETLSIDDYTASFATKDVLTHGDITLSSVTLGDGTGLASNYFLKDSDVTVSGGDITAKVLSATADGVTREYDGTTDTTLSNWNLTGLVDGEALGVAGTGAFDSANAGTTAITAGSVTLSDGTGTASNYSLANTAVTAAGSITQKVLTATADGVTREYDGTTDTTLSNWNLTGLVDGEALGVAGTGAFDSANAGTTAITAGSVTLSDGTGTASNYSLANTAVTAAGEITQKVLSATADGVTREYDGTTDTTLSNWNLTGLVDGEALGVAGTGAFDSANAGTTAITADSVTLSDGTGTASNYSLAKTAVTAAGSITQKVLTAAAEGETREYDGTTDTTLSNWNLTGLVGGEALGVTGTGAFDSANAGTTAITADSVTLSDGAGGSASNYSLANTAVTAAGSITQKVLTAAAVGESREYDGTTSASLTTDGWNLTGLVGTETLSVDDYTASFATKDVLTHGDITLSSVTLGDGTGTASNYSLASTAVTVSGGDITAKGLTISADNMGKVFGVQLPDSVSGSSAFTNTATVGTEKVDTVTLTYGEGKDSAAEIGVYENSITASAAVGSLGFDAANYAITYLEGDIEVVSTDAAYYRTVAGSDLNWEDISSWEYSGDQVNWFSATQSPDAVKSINIEVSNGSTISINQDIVLDQTLINGTVNVVASDITVVNAVEVNDMHVVGSVNLDSGSGLYIGMNSHVDVDGTFNSEGTVSFNDSSLEATNGSISISVSSIEFGELQAGAGTVTYDGDCAQVISGVTYNNLILSGSGAKTLSSVANVNGNLTGSADLSLNSGSEIVVNGTSSVAGNLSIADNSVYKAAGIFDFSGTSLANSGTLELCNTASFGSLSEIGGTVSYTGALNQTAADIDYNILKIDKSSAVSVVSASDTLNAVELDMTGGVLNVDDINITASTAFNEVEGAASLVVFGNSSDFGSTFDAGKGLVKYIGENQTLLDYNYYNVTVAGSGNITLDGSVENIFDIATGTGVLAGGIDYMAGSTLAYSATRTATDIEFPGNEVQNLTVYNESILTMDSDKTVADDLYVEAGSKIIFLDGTELRLGGSPDVDGEVESDPAGSGGIILTGTGVTVSGTGSYGDVTFAGGSGGTFTEDVNITDLIVETGATAGTGDGVDITVRNADVNGTLDVGNGTVDINGEFDGTGGNVIFGLPAAPGTGTLELGGDVISLGTFSGGHGTVVYDLEGDQDVDGVEYWNLEAGGTGVKTVSNDADVNNDFEVKTGVKVVLANGSDITVGGNTDVDGEVESDPAGSGGIILTGTGVTVSGTGSYGDVTFAGGSGGTFTEDVNITDLIVETGATAGTGDGVDITVRNADVNGTLDVGNGTVDINGEFDGTGGNVIFGLPAAPGTGTLELGGDVISLGTFSGGHGTVVYDLEGDQDVDGVEYWNLEAGGTGVKTVSNDADVNNDFEVKTGVKVVLANGSDITVGGNTDVDGEVESDPAGSGGIILTGTGVTVSGTGSYGDVTFAGGSGGTFTEDVNITDLIVETGATAGTGDGVDITVRNADVNGTLDVGNGTVDINGEFDGTGGNVIFGLPAAPGTGTLELGGDVISLGTFSGGHGTVVYDSEEDQTINTVEYWNIETRNGGIKTVSGNIDINNDLIMYKGIIEAGDNDITVVGNIIEGNIFSNENMVSTSGAGKLNRHLNNGIGTYFFPVGTNNGGVSEYTPVTMEVRSGSFSNDSYLSVKSIAEKEPHNTDSSNYLERYWVTESYGISNINFDVNCQYVENDIVGTESSMYFAEYSGLEWKKYGNADLINHSFSAEGLTVLGNFTGRKIVNPNQNPDNTMNDGMETQTHTSWRNSIDNGPETSIDSSEGFEPNEVEGIGLGMNSMITFDLSIEGAVDGEYSIGAGIASAFMIDGEYGLNSVRVSGMTNGEYGVSAGHEELELASEGDDEFGAADLTFNFNGEDSGINFEGMAILADKHPTFKTEIDLILEKI